MLPSFGLVMGPFASSPSGSSIQAQIWQSGGRSGSQEDYGWRQGQKGIRFYKGKAKKRSAWNKFLLGP